MLACSATISYLFGRVSELVGAILIMVSRALAFHRHRSQRRYRHSLQGRSMRYYNRCLKCHVCCLVAEASAFFCIFPSTASSYTLPTGADEAPAAPGKLLNLFPAPDEEGAPGKLENLLLGLGPGCPAGILGRLLNWVPVAACCCAEPLVVVVGKLENFGGSAPATSVPCGGCAAPASIHDQHVVTSLSTYSTHEYSVAGFQRRTHSHLSLPLLPPDDLIVISHQVEQPAVKAHLKATSICSHAHLETEVLRAFVWVVLWPQLTLMQTEAASDHLLRNLPEVFVHLLLLLPACCHLQDCPLVAAVVVPAGAALALL